MKQRLNIATVEGLASAISQHAHKVALNAKYYANRAPSLYMGRERAMDGYESLRIDMEALDAAWKRMMQEWDEMGDIS